MSNLSTLRWQTQRLLQFKIVTDELEMKTGIDLSLVVRVNLASPYTINRLRADSSHGK